MLDSQKTNNTKKTDWDNYGNKTRIFLRQFVLDTSTIKPILIIELCLNPLAVLNRLMARFIWFSRTMRLAIPIIMVLLFLVSPINFAVPLYITILYAVAYIIASLLSNLLLLHIHATTLRIHNDVATGTIPSDDLWRQISAPDKISNYIREISEITSVSARRIPINLLSDQLNKMISIDNGTIIISGEMSTYEYSQFLVDCIRLTHEQLHWFVDQEDFVEGILPSFVAEALSVIALYENNRIHKEIDVRKLEEDLSDMNLDGIFTDEHILKERINDVCSYCCYYQNDKCERNECYIVGCDAKDFSKITLKHADLSALWYILLNYAIPEFKKIVQLKTKKEYTKTWKDLDGFSLFASLPHLPEYRFSVARSKKRLIYVPKIERGLDNLCHGLGINSCSSYVNGFRPKTDLLPGTKCIRTINGWLSSSTSLNIGNDHAKKLLEVAIDLFLASCGRADVGFVGTKRTAQEAVNCWKSILGNVYPGIDNYDTDYGIFDRHFAVGSTMLDKRKDERGVVVLFKVPEELAKPFERRDEVCGLKTMWDQLVEKKEQNTIDNA